VPSAFVFSTLCCAEFNHRIFIIPLFYPSGSFSDINVTTYETLGLNPTFNNLTAFSTVSISPTLNF
jgi:hypothetical protein